MYTRIPVVSPTSHFANDQFANVCSRFANVECQFANAYMPVTSGPNVQKTFSFGSAVDERTRNNLYAAWMKERGISCLALSSGYTYLAVCLAPQWIKDMWIKDICITLCMHVISRQSITTWHLCHRILYSHSYSTETMLPGVYLSSFCRQLDRSFVINIYSLPHRSSYVHWDFCFSSRRHQQRWSTIIKS